MQNRKLNPGMQKMSSPQTRTTLLAPPVALIPARRIDRTQLFHRMVRRLQLHRLGALVVAISRTRETSRPSTRNLTTTAQAETAINSRTVETSNKRRSVSRLTCNFRITPTPPTVFTLMINVNTVGGVGV